MQVAGSLAMLDIALSGWNDAVADIRPRSIAALSFQSRHSTLSANDQSSASARTERERIELADRIRAAVAETAEIAADPPLIS